MRNITRRHRIWNNKTRRNTDYGGGGGAITAEDLLKLKPNVDPIIIDAATYATYKMFKSYKQVGEVWELRNMSIEAPEMFVYDAFLYIKHIKQGNKTHVKYLRMPYEEDVDTTVVSSLQNDVQTVDSGLYAKLRMYKAPTTKGDIWEMRNRDYFENPLEKFIYEGFLYTLLEKQPNKTHKKYSREPVQENPLQNPVQENPVQEEENPVQEEKEEEEEEENVPINSVSSKEELNQIQTVDISLYKKLRMYKAPTNKGDIWEMRNRDYFEKPLEKFIYEGFLYELLEKQPNKTHKKYARRELSSFEEPVEEPEENPVKSYEEESVKSYEEEPVKSYEEEPVKSYEEEPLEEPDENPEEEPLENPLETPLENPVEEPDEEENFPNNSVDSQEELQKIQTVDTALYKKLRMHKAPTTKGDIWEMRNKDYFENPIEKFVYEEFLYELLIKQTNKTHKKYARREVATIPPTEMPQQIMVETKGNQTTPASDHNLTLQYKSRSGNTETITGLDDFLYPSLDDPDLSQKLALRKEFSEYKYDGKIADIKTLSNKLCANPEFKLMPHQLFIKNFLSRNTPYRSILLYHGLGSGKTCSAIGIAEEMRATMKQTGSNQRIMVIASTNVQDNFRLQLFDERKLVNTQSSIESCIGSSLLREINPENTADMPKEKIVAQANTIINSSYSFMGYMQLANYIQNKIIVKAADYTEKQRHTMEIANIKRIFNNRLIIIDEVHNVPGKTVAPLLTYITKHADNLRLVLLSATPMYNSVDEIVYLTNLMNINDGRPTIKPTDIFDPVTKQITEAGQKLLKMRLNGYVSYVRGENPYTFPFRLYPDIFEPEDTFVTRLYPKKSLTGRPNVPSMMGMKNRIYLTRMGEEQEKTYQFIANHVFLRAGAAGNIFSRQQSDDDEAIFENMESFGYTKLQVPVQACIMTFPNLKEIMDDEDKDEIQQTIKKMVGKEGLATAMKYKEEKKKIDEETTIFMKHAFEYRKGYEGLFSLEGRLRQCSGKISKICDKILVSQGIIIVYSQYIDGGIVPMALALEELGFARYGSMQQFVKPLFKKGAAINQEPRDAETMLLRPDFIKTHSADEFKQAKYMILSGDKFFSQNNAEDIKYATNRANMHGHNIRVILISKAASEGLDFKFIRQVHILDPWYNLNRIEQIVGRGVRNMSHCGLPFEERNVEVYLHASLISADEEVADHYIYRYAETKAITIGKVTRLLKEVSVDCVLNIGQSNFTDVQLASIAENQEIMITPSSNPKKMLHIRVGDKPGTEACDYADNCNYVCAGVQTSKQPAIVETYGTNYLQANMERLLDKTIELYRQGKKVYTKDEIWKKSDANTEEQLNYILEQLMRETVKDELGREGRIINRGNYYMFQPLEITDKHANLLDVSMPVDFKHDKIKVKIAETVVNQNLQTEMSAEYSPTDAIMGEKSADTIIGEIAEYMEIVDDPIAHNLEPGEKNWAKNLNSGRLIQYHLMETHGLSRDQISKYAFEHILDTLHYREKRTLIEAIHKGTAPEHIKPYFEQRMLKDTSGKTFGYLLSRVTKDVVKNVFLLYENGVWIEEEPGDMVSYKELLRQRFGKDVSKFNVLLGFMGYFKGRGTTWSIVFKTKMMNIGKNNKGAYLLNEGKAEILKKYNMLMDEVGGIKASADHFADLSKIGLGLVVEILMRHYNEMEALGRIWTLSIETALFNGIENI